jgi:hypothetical protein
MPRVPPSTQHTALALGCLLPDQSHLYIYNIDACIEHSAGCDCGGAAQVQPEG